MKKAAPCVLLKETGVRMPFHSRMPLSIAGQVIHCDTRHKLEFVNLTELVEKQIMQSGICEGLAVVQSLHSTAAVFLNEWQDALLEDLQTLLGTIGPRGSMAPQRPALLRLRPAQCRLSSAGVAFGNQCRAERVRRKVTTRPMVEHYSGGVGWPAEAFPLGSGVRRRNGSLPSC